MPKHERGKDTACGLKKVARDGGECAADAVYCPLEEEIAKHHKELGKHSRESTAEQGDFLAAGKDSDECHSRLDGKGGRDIDRVACGKVCQSAADPRSKCADRTKDPACDQAEAVTKVDIAVQKRYFKKKGGAKAERGENCRCDKPVKFFCLHGVVLSKAAKAGE